MSDYEVKVILEGNGELLAKSVAAALKGIPRERIVAVSYNRNDGPHHGVLVVYERE
jgi:hypothetical protein